MYICTLQEQQSELFFFPFQNLLVALNSALLYMLKKTSSTDWNCIHRLEVIAKSVQQLSFNLAAGRMAACSICFVELKCCYSILAQ